jgi:hypothetical protein
LQRRWQRQDAGTTRAQLLLRPLRTATGAATPAAGFGSHLMTAIIHLTDESSLPDKDLL